MSFIDLSENLKLVPLPVVCRVLSAARDDHPFSHSFTEITTKKFLICTKRNSVYMLNKVI